MRATARRLRAHRAPDERRALPEDDPPSGSDDPLHDLRLQQPAPDADRARHHRHLQRRDEQALLPERHPSRVDVGVLRGVVEPAVPVQAARGALVGRRLERGPLVEAEALGGLEDRRRAEGLADVAEDGVDRVGERVLERDRPEGRGRVEVVHALAVHRAVAGVEEGRRGRVLPGLERGRRRHDLERRAWHEEAGARAVQQRRRLRAVGRDRGDAVEVVLDAVRVEARRGRHRLHLPRARVESDDRTAARAELLERDPLRLEVEGREDVVALDRLAAQLVERLVERGRQVRVRGGQVVVERALEPGPRATHRRVADDVRGERTERVAAEVERPRPDLALDVPGETLPRPEGEDQAAVDRELGHALDRVVLPRGQPRRGPGLPVGRHHDEDGDQSDRDIREPDDARVHRGRFARWETRRRPASRRKLATTLVPP